MLLHFYVQDSPESGYMVRQKLGEWQARYTSMIINGTARRSCAISCSAVVIPGASQTYHTTLSQLPKGADYAACVGCVMRILTFTWLLWVEFFIADGDEDSELVTHVVQLMVQLTTRVGVAEGRVNLPSHLQVFRFVCRAQVFLVLKSCSICAICRTAEARWRISGFKLLYVFQTAAGLQGGLLQV